MYNRGFSSTTNYRYGFNGKEKDNEVKGNGNQQDYGMRIYDPRLGRFLSSDPIGKYFPWNSYYAFAENDVMSSIDLDGLEKYKVITEKNGSVTVNFNKKDPEGENGLVQYGEGGPIVSQFKKPEEAKAAKQLDKLRETKPSTVGITVLYNKPVIKKQDAEKVIKKEENKEEDKSGVETKEEVRIIIGLKTSSKQTVALDKLIEKQKEVITKRYLNNKLIHYDKVEFLPVSYERPGAPVGHVEATALKEYKVNVVVK